MYLILAPKRRQNRIMRQTAPLHGDRTRQNLRLDPALGAAIDRARLKRAGNVSRNTWITEAILEKLSREEPASFAELESRNDT